MRAVWRWSSGVLVTAVGVATAPRCVAQQVQPDSAAPASLDARLEALNQQVRILQRLRELAADSAAAAAKDKVTGTASARDGFGIKSADGKFAVRLRGLVQTDGRFFLSDSAVPVTNTLFLRRARPILEATVGKYLEVRLQPDFGQGTTVLFDAYTDVKASPAFAVRVGKFKTPVDLEQLQSASDIVLAERSLASNLAPNRDVGLQLSGELDGGTVAWQAGVFNGVPDLGNGDGDVSDAKDFVARVFLQPFKTGALKGLGVGVAGSTGIERGTTAAPQLASYRTGGQQTWFRYASSTATPGTNAFADGRRSRLAPQAYFYTGPLGLHGEYIESWQAVSRAGVATVKLKHTAWQTTGSFFLTGEKNSWRSAAPKKPFDPKAGTFGALEIAARYSELGIDDATFPNFASAAGTPGEARAWAVGLNWYLARGIKTVVDYERTTFTGGTATGDRAPESFIATRVQYSF
jgi:phosphate-selective porin OprO/OprP